jgi:hypothetical protein
MSDRLGEPLPIRRCPSCQRPLTDDAELRVGLCRHCPRPASAPFPVHLTPQTLAGYYDPEASAEYGKHLFQSEWLDSHARSHADHIGLEDACQQSGLNPSDVLPLLPPLAPPEVTAARREAAAERERKALADRMAEIEAAVVAGRKKKALEELVSRYAGGHLFQCGVIYTGTPGGQEPELVGLEEACRRYGVDPSDVLPLLPAPPTREEAARLNAEAVRDRDALVARMAQIEALVAAGRRVQLTRCPECGSAIRATNMWGDPDTVVLECERCDWVGAERLPDPPEPAMPAAAPTPVPAPAAPHPMPAPRFEPRQAGLRWWQIALALLLLSLLLGPCRRILLTSSEREPLHSSHALVGLL